MTITTHQLTPPATFAQWLSRLFAALARDLDANTITPENVRDEQIRYARIALLNAEQEEERYHHTAQMLRQRIERLQRP